MIKSKLFFSKFQTTQAKDERKNKRFKNAMVIFIFNTARSFLKNYIEMRIQNSDKHLR